MLNRTLGMDKCKKLKESIRTIPDFPVRGIMFRDVTTLMKDRNAFGLSCECLLAAAKDLLPFDLVAGIESRGFIFGSILANKTNTGFIPVRKPGKLPARVLSIEYELEYGTDSVEVHMDAIEEGVKYLVVDDLLATGGTAEATCKLIEKGGGKVAGCLFLVELPDLGGRHKLGQNNVISIIEFEGE
jgi:adenine phosphoribosyltransferase